MHSYRWSEREEQDLFLVSLNSFNKLLCVVSMQAESHSVRESCGAAKGAWKGGLYRRTHPVTLFKVNTPPPIYHGLETMKLYIFVSQYLILKTRNERIPAVACNDHSSKVKFDSIFWFDIEDSLLYMHKENPFYSRNSSADPVQMTNDDFVSRALGRFRQYLATHPSISSMHGNLQRPTAIQNTCHPHGWVFININAVNWFYA